MAETEDREKPGGVRFSVRQLLAVSTFTCVALGLSVGGVLLVLFLASSIFPGIVLLVALALPQLVLFLVLRRWLPKVNRDPIQGELASPGSFSRTTEIPVEHKRG